MGVRAVAPRQASPLPVGPDGSAHPLIGERFDDDRYRILRWLGGGGQASLFVARQTRLGREVALKRLHDRLLGDLDSVRCFLREGRALAGANHPGIPQVYDLGRTREGDLFIAMELIGGAPLRGPLPVPEAVRCVVALLEILEAIHGRGWIHCDIKAENVLRTADGRIKLIDFGLAVRCGSTSGVVSGTPHAMAPEQTTGRDPIDDRADIYTVGALLHDLLTGVTIVSSSLISPTDQLLAQVQRGEIQRTPGRLRPDVPLWLDSIVEQALATAPAQRFQDAAEMRRALTEGARRRGWGVAGVGDFRTGRRRQPRVRASAARAASASDAALKSISS